MKCIVAILALLFCFLLQPAAAAVQTVTVTIGQLGPDVFMEWEGSVSDLTVSAGTGLAPPSNFYIYQNYIASVNGAPLSDCKYCMYVVYFVVHERITRRTMPCCDSYPVVQHFHDPTN